MHRLTMLNRFTRLYGGPVAVSKIIGLDSRNYVDKVLRGKHPVPTHWITKLQAVRYEKAREYLEMYKELMSEELEERPE